MSVTNDDSIWVSVSPAISCPCEDAENRHQDVRQRHEQKAGAHAPVEGHPEDREVHQPLLQLRLPEHPGGRAEIFRAIAESEQADPEHHAGYTGKECAEQKRAYRGGRDFDECAASDTDERSTDSRDQHNRAYFES